MRTVLLAFLFSIDARYCRHIPNKSGAEDGAKLETAEEIQHAVCRVATEEVEASANATITKQLKGVCSAKAMNARIDELQKILMTEIEVFKLMLVSAGYTTPRPAISLPIEVKSSETYEDYDYAYDYDNQTQVNVFKSLEYTNKTQSLQQNYVETQRNNNNDKAASEIGKEEKLDNQTHSKMIGETYPREHEVKENNETIKTTDMGKAFLYYWRIPDFLNLLKEDLEIMSPLIEYLGNTMFMKLSTQHLGSNYISLELVTPSGFLKPFKFVIIHGESTGDFNSPLLRNTKPSFAILRLAKNKIQNFVNFGALLIKLLVFVDV